MTLLDPYNLITIGSGTTGQNEGKGPLEKTEGNT